MKFEFKTFEDKRGQNKKFFEQKNAVKVGFKEVKEVFTTTNKRGVVRAFHYQGQPEPQQKIVMPLAGSFNVRIIDMENQEVIEYDNWAAGPDCSPLFVKAGNMLGYVALEDNSVMVYIGDNEFNGELNHGVHPFSFNVDWKFDGEFIISERDLEADIVDFDNL